MEHALIVFSPEKDSARAYGPYTGYGPAEDTAQYFHRLGLTTWNVVLDTPEDAIRDVLKEPEQQCQPPVKENSMYDSDVQRILDEITGGDFDMYLKDLLEAISDRQEVRKAAVLAQVHEVFGANADITIPRKS